MKRITVNITDAQYEFLTRYMTEKDKTQSDAVQECIQGSLDVQKWIDECEERVSKAKTKKKK